MSRISLLVLALLMGMGVYAWSFFAAPTDPGGGAGLESQGDLPVPVDVTPDLVSPEAISVRATEVPGAPGSADPFLDGAGESASVSYPGGLAGDSELVQLEVVDEAGIAQPNYPLIWKPHWVPPETPKHIYDNQRVVADAQGRIKVRYWNPGPNAQARLMPGRVGCSLRSQVPWHDSLQWEIGPDPNSPRQLVVPKSGAVRVVLQDPAGEPWPLRAKVHATYGLFTGKIETAKPGAKTMLAFLPLGEAITIGAESEGPAETVWKTIEPLVAGESTREVTLVLTDPTFRLFGTLHTPEGRPLAQAQVHFSVPGHPRVMFRTDSKGGFRAKLPFGGRMTVHMQAGLYGTAIDHQVAVNTIALQQGIENDLGALTLQPLSGMLTGIVRIPSGDPAAHWALLAEVREASGVLVPFARVSTDSQGRFQLQGDRFDRPLILRHQASFKVGEEAFVVSEPLSVRPEASPLRLDLVRAARWAGQMHLPHGPEYELWVRYAGGHEARVTIQPGGRYYSDDLAPGQVTLHVVRKGEHAPIATLDNVGLVAGPQTDARLQAPW